VTPYEQARTVYRSEHSVRSFEEDLHWHLLNGYVISRPDFFIMGRHVDSKAAPGLILNPSWLFHPKDCDCWHVWLFAGDIAPAFGMMPFPLPLVSFERKNDLRFLPLESIRRLSAGGI
jgi:hypothetical protein